MAKRYLKGDYIIYIAARIASTIVSIVPLRLALYIGNIAGFVIYHFHPKRKRIAYLNLKAAFSKEKAPSELKRILKKTYANYGRSIIEILRIPRVSPGYLKRYIRIEGRENFDRAFAEGRGIIFLASHFGNWELSGLKSAQEGLPIYILARVQRFARLNALLNSYREKLGCRVIKRGMASREIVRALKENKIVGILSDQDAGRNGVFIPLLGRPVSYPIGAARLARKTGALIVPAFIRREEGPCHILKLHEPMAVAPHGDHNTRVKNVLEKYNKILASYIREYPDQWIWVYTRWKSTPLRKIIILTDGKRGHLNQSMAALEVIKKCRRDSGFKDEDTHHEIIEVKFKNRLARPFLAFCARFAAHACQGCMVCLKLCLDGECYRRLAGAYADIVISCGSSLAAVNILLSRENNARNVILMKPGAFSLKNFDVAIIPGHDRPPARDNVVITEGSPGIVSKETMRDGGERIKRLSSLGNKKRIGLLMGGDTAGYGLTTDLTGRLIDEIELSADKLDTELLVTTSRRTPRDVEKLLKSRLGPNPRCRLLIIANEGNIDNAVGGILALSDIVLVSEESISMISEAASSGKHTVVFELENRRPLSKHDYALKNLASLGYITRTPVDRICEVVTALSGREAAGRRLDNGSKMYDKLYRII